MLGNIPILSLLLFSPLLGIVVLLLMPANKGNWIKKAAIAASLLPLLLALWLFASMDHDHQGFQFEEQALWVEIPLDGSASSMQGYAEYAYQFYYHLGVDGMSASLLLLTALLTFLAAMAAVHVKKRWKAFYIWLFILEIGMLGVFMARDLFLFFVCFELTLVPAYFLISIWGMSERVKTANRFLIYNGIGSAFMLFAFILLIHACGFHVVEQGQQQFAYYSGSLDIVMSHVFEGSGQSASLVLTEGMKTAIILLLLIAFGIKLPLFPFHTWMLHVHKEAPVPVVMLHAGVMLKMGAYGIIRFIVFLFPDRVSEMSLLIAVLGLINLLYGAVLAFVQTEFRLLLAYASISHMGIVMLGLASFNASGLTGALFQLISHGLISALLFLIIGSIYERTGTTSIDQLGGLAKPMPFISGMLLAAGLALLGLPGMSGFVGEFLAFAGLFKPYPLLAVAAALGIILTAAYVLRGIMALTHGPLRGAAGKIRDARFVEAVPMIVLMAFILLLGVYPAVLGDLFQISLYQIVTQIGG